MSYQPIENYGVIGDLHTVALVGMDGSIDFMCFPYFDSPSIFAALLDDQKGGRFKIAPLFNDARHKQLYLPDTNILLTRFLSDDGVAEVSDFMPVAEKRHAHQLVRRAKTVRGEMRFHMVCAPAFDYGRATHASNSGTATCSSERRGRRDVLRLRAEVPLRVEGGAVSRGVHAGRRPDGRVHSRRRQANGPNPRPSRLGLRRRRSSRRP